MIKREAVISIRLSEEEIIFLKSKTESLGLSQSDYIRHLIFSGNTELNNTISTVDRRIVYLLLNLVIAQKSDLERKGLEELVNQYALDAKEQLKNWGYNVDA